jgi:hypothetical protein
MRPTAAENQLDDEKQSTAVMRRTAGDIAVGERGVRLATFDDAFRFAKVVVTSGLAPKGIDTPEKALIAIQAGAELGFSPMRALAAVTVINGRAGLMGEAALAKIRDSGICSKPPVVKVDGEGDARRGFVRFQRRDMDEAVEVSFSVAEAKKAKLWTKGGPWTEYPDDMLGWRAVARMGKLYFSDVLLGLTIAEELQDYPVDATPKSYAPPAEPDPLLATAQPAEVIESEIVGSSGDGSLAPAPSLSQSGEFQDGAAASAETAALPLDDIAEADAADKIEGEIACASSFAELQRTWKWAAPTVAMFSETQRLRMTKLYESTAAGFKAKR